MDQTDSGIVLPPGVRVVAPAPPVEPWRDGEQMGHVDTPIFWLDLQLDVKRRWGPLLARLYRAEHGRA